jgi:acyl dehydratase
MSALVYLKALARTAARPSAGAKAPRLERTLPPAVAPAARLDAFRALTCYPDDGFLPITWPYAWSLAAHLENLVDPRFPLPLMGTIHVRTRIVQRRPIGASEALRLVCSIDGQREAPRGVEFDLVTHGYAGAELVWEGAATMLRLTGKEPPPRLGVDRPPLDGLGARNQVWRVAPATARAFARVTGDLNPIHLSGLTARLFGFPGIVAHGMWSLTRAAGEHPELVRRAGAVLSCDFKRPIILPARVVSRCWVEGDGGVALRLLDARADTPHLIGTLRVD